jgi:hypothetical protein
MTARAGLAASPTASDQRRPSAKRADRHIVDEANVRIHQEHAARVFGNLDDPSSDRFHATVRNEVQPAAVVWSRDRNYVCLDDPYPAPYGQRRVIGGGAGEVGVRHAL